LSRTEVEKSALTKFSIRLLDKLEGYSNQMGIWPFPTRSRLHCNQPKKKATSGEAALDLSEDCEADQRE
jgi:hypothetical protein